MNSVFVFVHSKNRIFLEKSGFSENCFPYLFFGSGANLLIQKFPSPGGRGQGRGIISDVFTLPLPLPQGRGDLINGFDPLPIFSDSPKNVSAKGTKNFSIVPFAESSTGLNLVLMFMNRLEACSAFDYFLCQKNLTENHIC
ncbi:MAG: hypothetical protein AB7S75_11040 [Desulfococcaceae bacterium]